MKASLDHLPPEKQQQLRSIAARLCELAPVERIILFGSYARGDWVEDHETLYYSDYDLLVIVHEPAVAENAALWLRAREELRPLAGKTPVTLLPHDIRQLNHEIRRGRYFYSDVVNEGIELYDSRRFQLAKPKAKSAEERLEQALYDFRYWFGSATQFWHGVGYYISQEQWSHAAFSLHQATERFFHAALLVFIGYKPRTHDIEELAKQTAPLHEALVGALPRESEEESRLFDLLKRAYIEARYSKAYRITKEELRELLARVRELAKRVQQACRDEMGKFVRPEAVGELPEPPEPRDVYQLPPAPPLDDTEAVERWQERVAWLSLARAEVERRQGRREGEERGLRKGKAEGLRKAIESLCEVLEIALSPERRQEMAKSSIAGLEELLAIIKRERRWPE